MRNRGSCLPYAFALMTACTGPYADRVRPDAPGSPHVTLSGQALILSWTDRSETEDAFVIERRAGTQEYTRIAEVPPNQTQFTDNSELDASEEYTYRILARNESIHSAPSSPASLCRPDVDEDAFPGRGPRVSLRGECPLSGRPIDCDDSDPGVGAETPFYRDTDGDGRGPDSSIHLACARPPDFTTEPGDCDDSDATVYAGAPEICDGKVNDCEGEADESLLCFPGPAPSSSVSANAGQSMRPRLTLAGDDQEQPVVAWEDNTSGNYEVYVRRWDASRRRWVEMGQDSASGGGISATPTPSRAPVWAAGDRKLIVGVHPHPYPPPSRGRGESGETPSLLSLPPLRGKVRMGGVERIPLIILWEEWVDSTPAVSAKQWDTESNQWKKIDDTSPLSASAAPDVLAWSDDSTGNYEIYVKRRAGSGWEELGSFAQGGASRSPGHSFAPSVAVDSTGTPWVAWEEITAGKSEIHLRRWDAATAQWLPLGKSSIFSDVTPARRGTDMYPSLVLDRSDHPLIAWQAEGGSNFEIYVAGLIVDLPPEP